MKCLCVPEPGRCSCVRPCRNSNMKKLRQDILQGTCSQVQISSGKHTSGTTDFHSALRARGGTRRFELFLHLFLCVFSRKCVQQCVGRVFTVVCASIDCRQALFAWSSLRQHFAWPSHTGVHRQVPPNTPQNTHTLAHTRSLTSLP